MNLSNDRFIARWIYIALVYFALAVGLGVFMAASHDFTLRAVHVHLNLLGWVSAALMGVIYRLFPQAAASRLARLHFWLYNAALPVMMAGLASYLRGVPGAEPVLAAASVAVLVAVLIFAVAIWRRPSRGSLDLRQAEAAA